MPDHLLPHRTPHQPLLPLTTTIGRPLQVPATAGKAALAMEAFARALRQLPTIIADNAGLDSSELGTHGTLFLSL